MDHFGWDTKRGLLIVSALGNDTLEIVGDWKRRNTITGLEHPQAAVYIPDVDRIAVSSQSGKLRFYDAASYVLVQTLDFGSGANTDNMRYDPRSKRLYVGYGAGARGAIAVVDPATMERMEEYQVGTHPESFQLETTGPRIFVNLPGQGSIGVIDRTFINMEQGCRGLVDLRRGQVDDSDQVHHRLQTRSQTTGLISPSTEDCHDECVADSCCLRSRGVDNCDRRGAGY
jgi:hypothetical protein